MYRPGFLLVRCCDSFRFIYLFIYLFIILFFFLVACTAKKRSKRRRKVIEVTEQEENRISQISTCVQKCEYALKEHNLNWTRRYFWV